MLPATSCATVSCAQVSRFSWWLAAEAREETVACATPSSGAPPELVVALHVHQQPAVLLRAHLARLLERPAEEQARGRGEQPRQPRARAGAVAPPARQGLLLLLLLPRVPLRVQVAERHHGGARRRQGSLAPHARRRARSDGRQGLPERRQRRANIPQRV